MRILPLLLFCFVPAIFCAGQLNIPCNNWLSLPSYQSYVQVGDLDIPGDKITVEAIFVRTAPYTNGYNWAGDLVSKHVDPIDVNYLLRPNNAEITTSNGYFITPPVCDIALNKVYHVALVYDGSTLKFYRNGFLMSSVPATGNLFQNNHQTRIGLYDGNLYNTNLIGYINEVRIWNVARTQNQLQTYRSSSLPSPSTQPGLQAYYTFDNLVNKQGNTTWNGTTGGSASINATMPFCSYTADSCTVRANIGNIINAYTPVLGRTICDNGLIVEDASSFNTGDTVLLIQMKGAVMDTTNSNSFGTILDYKSAGNYEMNLVSGKTGNTIRLKNNLTRQYDIPQGKVQLIRVPYYTSADITSTLTCLPWDGDKGGVLVLNVRDTIIMNANINVSGKGFRGGADPVTSPPVFYCYENQFYYPPLPDLASEKGEGIAIVSSAKSYGKGDATNGGGGGNSHNSGGGGGGNGGAGGSGGYNFEGSPCSNTPFDNRGIGGRAPVYNLSDNKIFLGGGGGAGHSNNTQGFHANGGPGAGIVIVLSDKILANGNKILATGDPGYYCGSGGPACHEGMGGGGAGGTVLLNANTMIDPLIIDNSGGKGADMTASGYLKVGPGGGGGGGVLWVKAAALPPNTNATMTGGGGGVCTAYGNDPFGAVPGQTGYVLHNLVIPTDNTPFKPNIDSVRIGSTKINCDSFAFNGLAFTNTNPISTWQWYFSDGGTANTQNTGHTFAGGTYTVKLVVTDINGCRDSIETNITASTLTTNAGPDVTICNGSSTVLQGSSSGAIQYSWSPAAYLNNTTILSPTATPPATTTFYLTVTNASGCTKTDSIVVNVRSAAAFSINPPAAICLRESFQLSAAGGDTYNWQPSGTLDNPTLFNPVATPAGTTTYTVTITDLLCGYTGNLSTTITVNPLPAIRASRYNDISCFVPNTVLTASGGIQYQWSPSSTLNNPLSASPLANPVFTTMYVVSGTDANGCTNKDSVLVKVNLSDKGGYLMPTAFTPNNDGLNDCYGVSKWGTIKEIEFSIYNRWGQRLFYTTNSADCWDGTFKGVLQTPDVYVYMIRAKTTCEPTVFRKGTFALIR